jgi:hypothetical protein
MRFGGTPGGKSAAQLAFGNDIGTGPEGGEEAQNGEVGIGLDRVADQRLLSGKSIGKTLVLGSEGRCGIKVKGVSTAAAIRQTATSSACS